MESPVGFAGTTNWTNNLQPELQLAGCEIATVSVSATSVGVPTTKRRVFVVAVKKSGDDTVKAKLSASKKNVERPAPATPTVGAFLGRQGCFFLKQGHQAREIFSFGQPAVTITREHIMGRKPAAGDFTAHPRDAGSREEAQELCWEDYVKLTTLRDTFDIPPTLRRCDVALVLQENTLAPMLREILNILQLRGRPKRMMEVSQGAETGQEEEFVINLASLLQEEMATAAVTRGITRAAAHSVEHSRSKVTPATTRSATRRAQ